MNRLGVIGYPIGHSISPRFQNAAIRHLKLDAEYEAVEVAPDDLQSFVARFRSEGWLGLNVTIPHKQAIARIVDRLTDEARIIGAVNTLSMAEGEMIGDNTDARGFLRALANAGVEARGSHCLILGTGGAARALAYAMVKADAASVTVAGRSNSHTSSLLHDLGSAYPGADDLLRPAGWAEVTTCLPANISLIVNATSVGMLGGPAPMESPILPQALQSHHIVFDAVYNPMRTPLLEGAEAAGTRCIGGLDMLVCQGAESFRSWFGVDAPLDVMYDAARKAMEEICSLG